MADDNSNHYVIDSSALLPCFLPDEKLPPSIESILGNFFKNKLTLTAPSILKYEIGNAIISAVRQKRLDPLKAKNVYSAFLDFSIQYLTPNYQDTLQLSLEHGLTFYDASYLCLAQEKKAKLLTLDKKLLTCLPK